MARPCSSKPNILCAVSGSCVNMATISPPNSAFTYAGVDYYARPQYADYKGQRLNWAIIRTAIDHQVVSDADPYFKIIYVAVDAYYAQGIDMPLDDYLAKMGFGALSGG